MNHIVSSQKIIQEGDAGINSVLSELNCAPNIFGWTRENWVKEENILKKLELISITKTISIVIIYLLLIHDIGGARQGVKICAPDFPIYNWFSIDCFIFNVCMFIGSLVSVLNSHRLHVSRAVDCSWLTSRCQIACISGSAPLTCKISSSPVRLRPVDSKHLYTVPLGIVIVIFSMYTHVC